MKTFTRDYRIEPYHSPVFDCYFAGLHPCVFDIETTGLTQGRGTARVILTAMLVPTPKGIRVTQFLAQDPYEEDRVLEATMQFLIDQHIDYVITYNGASFDLPFMNRRLESLHYPYRLELYNLDLYAFLRRYSILPGALPSMSQKSVEHYFGIGADRRDVITGRESVKLYYEYASGGSPVLEKVLLTHNREDVCQLYRVLRIAGYDDFRPVLRCGDLHQALAGYGLPVRIPSDTVKPEGSPGELPESGPFSCPLQLTPKLRTGTLLIRGRQLRAPYLLQQDDEIIESEPSQAGGPLRRFPLNAAVFPDLENDLTARFRASTSDFEIQIPLHSYGKALYCTLTDPNPADPGYADYAPLIRPENLIRENLIVAGDQGEPFIPEINGLSILRSAALFRRLSRG